MDVCVWVCVCPCEGLWMPKEAVEASGNEITRTKLLSSSRAAEPPSLIPLSQPGLYFIHILLYFMYLSLIVCLYFLLSL